VAKISSFQRLIKEDVDEEYKPLIDKIGFSINQFAEQVISALNKNITVTDNLNMEYKTIDITIHSTIIGIPNNTVQFKSGLRTKLKGIQVIKVENLTNPGALLSDAPFLEYSENNDIITINRINGLAISTKFRITFLTFGS